MKKFVKNLARAAVEVGVNVQSGDEVLVTAPTNTRDLAYEIAKLSYERGAKRVFVNFFDEEIGTLAYKHESLETLTDVPEFTYAHKNYIADVNGCVINILSEDPQVFGGLDAEKITARSRTLRKHVKPYYDKAMAAKIKWTIVAYPQEKWARLMFPDLKAAEAYKKLEKYIAETSRVTGDPVKAWTEHSAVLRRRYEKLNAANIKSFHYKNSLGTDVTVGMPENYIFAGGAEECDGVSFNPNIPSEEVFSAPHCRKVDGVIRASMPLCHEGNIIEGIELTLKDGKIISYNASKNLDVLKGIIETDEGSHRLGEIALVPYDSPIGRLNTLFYNTLFDENASCHFAIGAAYPTCVKGGSDMTNEQLAAAGLNDSAVHVDFMIGTKDLEITAETTDGRIIQIFKNGNFTVDFE